MNKFKIYKPNKQNNGVATSFDFNDKLKCLFVEMAKQKNVKDENGNAQFDWANKIRVKLNDIDMADILLVMFGIKRSLGQTNSKYKGLYHKNKDGDAIIKFDKIEDGYILGISIRKEEIKTALSQSINNQEAIVLKILLEKYIEKIHD